MADTPGTRSVANLDFGVSPFTTVGAKPGFLGAPVGAKTRALAGIEAVIELAIALGGKAPGAH